MTASTSSLGARYFFSRSGRVPVCHSASGFRSFRRSHHHGRSRDPCPLLQVQRGVGGIKSWRTGRLEKAMGSRNELFRLNSDEEKEIRGPIASERGAGVRTTECALTGALRRVVYLGSQPPRYSDSANSICIHVTFLVGEAKLSCNRSRISGSDVGVRN